MLSKEKFSKSYQNANVLNLVYKEKKNTFKKTICIILVFRSKSVKNISVINDDKLVILSNFCHLS